MEHEENINPTPEEIINNDVVENSKIASAESIEAKEEVNNNVEETNNNVEETDYKLEESSNNIEETNIDVEQSESNSTEIIAKEEEHTTVKTQLVNKQTTNDKLDAEEEEPDTDFYNSLDREKLVDLIEEKVQIDDLNKVKKTVGIIKAVFRSKSNQHKQELIDAFVQEGGNEEEYQAPVDPLEERFNKAFDIYKDKKAKYIEETEIAKQENLNKKNEILEELRKLIESDEELKTTYDCFKELQEKWKDIGPVPQKERNNLWQNYHFLVEKFFDKVKINKELKDLDLKKNLEKKIEICEKAEELLLEKSIKKSFQLLQKLHDEWRDVGPMPNDKKEEVWDRFSACTKKIHQRRRDFYTEVRDKQTQNHEFKMQLCEKVEEIVTLEIDNPKLWQEKTDEMLEAQKQWKTIGFAPRNVNDEIWNRFRNALNNFFKKKRDFFKVIKDDQKENYNQKVNICIQAEALKDSEDWRNTSNELIRLQKEWKAIGPVPKKYSDKIWKRFRAACDHFFNRKTNYFANIDSFEAENLSKKKAIVEEIKNYPFTDNNEENLNVIKDFQRKWMDIGHVPIKEKDNIQKTFRETIDSLMERLKLGSIEKSAINYKSKIEKLKDSSNSERIIRKERSVIAAKLSKLQSEIKTWENNIGFFANSKSADILKQEFIKKIEDAKQEIVILEEKLKYINQMGED